MMQALNHNPQHVASMKPVSTPSISLRTRRLRHAHTGQPVLYIGLPVQARNGVACSSSSSSSDNSSFSAGPIQSQQETGTISTPELAWKLLKDFTKQSVRGLAASYVESPEKRAALRTALVVAYANPYPPAGWAPSRRQAAAAIAASTDSPEAKDALQEAETASEDSNGGETSSPSTTGDSADQEVMFGVMAGSVRIGVRALRDWCQGLGLPYVKPVSRVDGAANPAAIKGGVYIKYNSKSKLCYVSAYESRDKGVLVQLAQDQLGHFPLGLFDEAMKNPAPEL
ncbi:hypothetical protein DUNSADRAFT_12796 [Dunaliella salina]|uniref:Uncharacterized protein n=1 Tax=Dunaliella salina TaxID=3046 RepID=A0ABQ7GAJ8_DUNSA|nr:hypothetical protein DUNSADRAFT_12796 [Dunaliella salina]|eukprot:KAF5831636.1 hypothetical protein DUNSADRAFT_12796 [Dunaliella salina]